MELFDWFFWCAVEDDQFRALFCSDLMSKMMLFTGQKIEGKGEEQIGQPAPFPLGFVRRIIKF
jgi:hypothetical protein